ncbi:protein adenylyltransferase SelO [Microbacterium radiodurans]|uniref:Protein nucleotidyltransferase YdiU n=1 Tax=Microbacterium radiodurans TaxID=661398 RepID=A0A5J5INR2_9MICO|nr:YdiU family protein [Microbacterium radiodurans]KAA9083785.1 YdiU family protein [Microbacterium radiodurans]
MTATDVAGRTVRLSHEYADALPELAVPWRAASAPAPRALVINDALAAELGLDAAFLRSPDGLALLVGTAPPADAVPVAQAYAGHQFGGYSPRLGDGRALLLGELLTPDGSLRDLHLKGSGPTPFARAGDGLAAVGPMLREYIVSEAMHALGIPTTRSLAVVATGAEVLRESALPGAVLARTAASHLRVGTAEFARGTGDLGVLRRLVDYAIARHHPAAADAANPPLELYRSVVAAQAELVARWMLVGFVHGVMNTDNMTLSGETIDYGPCAFIDAYDPASVYSSIDQGGRYAYGNQPFMAEWNLARLAEALLPLFADEPDDALARAQEVLAEFRPRFAEARRAGMRRKLGLPEDVTDDAVEELAGGFHDLLAVTRADYTTAFRSLSAAARGGDAPLRAALAGADPGPWLERWRAQHPDAETMDAANPVYIPRNHLVEEALAAAAAGDLEPLGWLTAVLSTPFAERSGAERYASPAPADFGAYRTFCGT